MYLRKSQIVVFSDFPLKRLDIQYACLSPFERYLSYNIGFQLNFSFISWLLIGLQSRSAATVAIIKPTRDAIIVSRSQMELEKQKQTMLLTFKKPRGGGSRCRAHQPEEMKRINNASKLAIKSFIPAGAHIPLFYGQPD